MEVETSRCGTGLPPTFFLEQEIVLLILWLCASQWAVLRVFHASQKHIRMVDGVV